MRVQVEKQFKVWRMKVDGRNFYYSNFRLLAHEYEKLETEIENQNQEISEGL